MKRSKSYFLIALALIFFDIKPLDVMADEKKNAESSKSNLIQINYYQGRLEQDFLPYYKQFEIVGSTKLPDIDADVVKLEIKPFEKKIERSLIERLLEARKKKIGEKGGDADEVKELSERIEVIANTIANIETVYWVRGKDDKTSSFRLIVPPLTGWKKKYYLTFTFYDKPGEDNKFILKIVNATLEKLKKIFEEEKQVSNKNAREKLKEALKEAVEEVKKYSSSDFYYFDWKDGKSKAMKKLPVFRFKDHPIIDNIRGVTGRIEQLKKEQKALTESKNVLEGIDQQRFKKLIGELKAILRDAIQRGIISKFPYSYSDIAKLESFKKSSEDVPKNFAEKFEDINTNAWIFNKLTDDSNKILFEIRGTFEQVHIVNEIEKECKEKKTQVKDDLERLLMNYYIEHTRIFSNKVSFPSNETELKRIRFGTIYGIGGALLSSGKDEKLDAFSYVGVKYYFGPVDRRRPNPFLTKSSRWSFNIGAVFNSEITYKGQKQEAAFGGMKPMFGIGYDLNPIFGINIGTIIFRQPSINPLSTKKDIKFAFYMGISYDIDLFNRIKSIIEPNK